MIESTLSLSTRCRVSNLKVAAEFVMRPLHSQVFISDLADVLGLRFLSMNFVSGIGLLRSTAKILSMLNVKYAMNDIILSRKEGNKSIM